MKDINASMIDLTKQLTNSQMSSPGYDKQTFMIAPPSMQQPQPQHQQHQQHQQQQQQEVLDQAAFEAKREGLLAEMNAELAKKKEKEDAKIKAWLKEKEKK